MNVNNLSTHDLAQFYGTQTYTWGPFKRFAMTDGCLYLAKNGCSWLMDLIASHQTPTLVEKSDYFQVWRLKPLNKRDKMAVVICEDGNGNEFLRQEIEYTDFPFDKIGPLMLFLEEGSIDGKTTTWVLMLPSER